MSEQHVGFLVVSEKGHVGFWPILDQYMLFTQKGIWVHIPSLSLPNFANFDQILAVFCIKYIKNFLPSFARQCIDRYLSNLSHVKQRYPLNSVCHRLRSKFCVIYTRKQEILSNVGKITENLVNHWMGKINRQEAKNCRKKGQPIGLGCWFPWHFLNAWHGLWRWKNGDLSTECGQLMAVGTCGFFWNFGVLWHSSTRWYKLKL